MTTSGPWKASGRSGAAASPASASPAPASASPAPASPVAPDPSLDRILTVPNVITFIRLACLPVFLWLLFGRENRAAAAGLLAALGITDFLDGYVARHFHQQSNLGKILDPVADRLLFFVGAGAILIDGSVPTWFAVLVLVREALVAVGTLVVAGLGGRRIDVTWYGKAGTFCLMIAFPLFLGSESTVGWADTAGVLAWMAGIPGLVLSWYAAILYVPMARRAVREARSESAAGSAQAAT